MNKKTFTFAATLIFMGIGISACSSTVVDASGGQMSQANQTSQTTFTRFPDVPIPVDSDIDLENTLVISVNQEWLGRLSLDTSYDATEMYDFYRKKTPGYGWREISSMRSAISVLTFTNNDRIATIQIEDKILLGSSLTITVLPRGASQFPNIAPRASLN